MGDAERRPTAASVEIVPVDPEHADARVCLAEYVAELNRRSERGFDPAAGVTALPHEVRPPAGQFLVAYDGGEAIGCGAVKHRPGAVSEIKRMWIAPAARGLGLGRRLLAELEACAIAGGARVARLETSGVLTEAMRLYRSAGWVEVAAFNDEPFADHWFESRSSDPLRARLGGVLRPFAQVDVFTTTPFGGNPVAVVLDAEGLSTEEMERFANWTNLSETTFVFPPSDERADYRVRIFTPTVELPFAGHPTLGTCHAWAAARREEARDEFVQECAAGLVRIRRGDAGLSFAAPPLLRDGPVDEAMVQRIATLLELDRDEILDAQWADNGPGWVAVLLEDASAVLAVRRPGSANLDLGIVGAYPPGSLAAFEVRAFFPKDGALVEDPVTGSLNAAIAPWLLRTGRTTAPYVVSQGTLLGRAGRVHVERDDDGTLWVGGASVTCVSGEVEL